MNGRGAILVVVLTVMLTATAGLAMAGEDTGTHVVTMFEPFSVQVRLTDDSSLKVSWDITVTDGVPMNAMLLDDENYDLFSQGLAYEAYDGLKDTYVNHSKHTVTVAEAGTYHVAVETTHSSMDTTTIDYSVKWGEGADDDGSPWCWPAALILAIIAGLLAALFGYQRSRNGGTDMTASPETPPPVDGNEAPAPGTGVVGYPAEDATALGPQPEPPDTPADDGNEAPAPGTGVMTSTPQDATELGPQPEPPDSPTPSFTPTGEGVTELSPQPEPPDMPPTDATETPDPDPLNPDAETVYAHGTPTADASPQPEPHDMPITDATETPVPDPLSPDAETVYARDMPTVDANPQAGPPEHLDAQQVARRPPPTE